MKNTKFGIWLYHLIEILDGETRSHHHIWGYSFFERIKIWVLKYFKVGEDD